MTKDELVFCINCMRSVYPGLWSDTPEKVRQLINDVYEVDVELSQVEELYNERIIEDDEYELMFKHNGYY
jgi:hypothetical protein